MGVPNLWEALLPGDSAACDARAAHHKPAGRGAAAASYRNAVAEMDGKVLAIDASVWILQCSRQGDLREAIPHEHARVLYIMLFRILSLLRYGATPVFVLEGDTPEAKMGRLQQRWGPRDGPGNRRGGRHDSLGRKVVELLDLLGVPHVDAPGEAEALCAALVCCGLAHGAVSSDVDALLFGADTVYRECRLSVDKPQDNALSRVDSAELGERCFGLRGGGGCARALQAVAVLGGCDYLVSGGRGVGTASAMEAVRQLTRGRQDDSSVLPDLLRFLTVGPDPRVTALKSCTGCKNCGHEKHGRRPCPECGPGPCKPKAEGVGCSCAFHRSEPERKFMRVIQRAIDTGPLFLADVRGALATYEQETQRARAAAEELRGRIGAFSWSSRPDVRGVYSLLHPLLGRTSSDPDKLLWTYGEVRDKLRPALMEWDMRQGPQPAEEARAVVEFRPRRIRACREEEGRYLIEFDRLPGVNTPDLEFDISQLSNSKLSKARHVRQYLVARTWPQLLALREEEEQALGAKPRDGCDAGTEDVRVAAAAAAAESAACASRGAAAAVAAPVAAVAAPASASGYERWCDGGNGASLLRSSFQVASARPMLRSGPSAAATSMQHRNPGLPRPPPRPAAACLPIGPTARASLRCMPVRLHAAVSLASAAALVAARRC